MKHYYIDTNVIIDMLADRGEFAEAASNLFDAAGRGEICVYISSLSYSNIYYIIRRYLGHEKTIESLKELSRYVGILPVNGKRGCKLNCVIFIFDSTVGDRPSAKGVHQHSRRA